jgi:Tol biopolymer transport system component
MVDPRPNLAIADWSPDGGLLFFYHSFAYDGAPTLWSGFKLRGIDIASGKIATLIPSDRIMAFRFSPDFSRLAYVLDEDDPRTLYIRTLASGEVTNFRTAVPRYDGDIYNQMGSIRWSDSGDRLIVFVGTADERSSMYLFDLLHSTSKRLLDSWLGRYQIEDWSVDETLRLHNVFEGRIETMNLETAQLTILGTPTPNP